MKKKLPKVIVIAGPTASGKTALAIELAKKFNGEIISADSQALYKDFVIGTAKEGKLKKAKNPLEICRILEGIPQYLVDCVDPKKQFSVAEYQKLCWRKIEQILAQKKTPFLVSGSGLYIDAVSEGYVFPTENKNPKITRKELEKLSLKDLIHKLQKLDPKSAKKIDLKNPRRIIRALEVTINTGIAYSAQIQARKPEYKFLKLGLALPTSKLQTRIDRRVTEMFKAGLVLEVQKLLQKYPKALAPFSSIGYKEIIGYIEGKYAIKEAVEKVQVNSRKYARRQMTWFRKSPNLIWIKNQKQTEKLIKEFLYV